LYGRSSGSRSPFVVVWALERGARFFSSSFTLPQKSMHLDEPQNSMRVSCALDVSSGA
jgi:hypothetical protein